MMLRAHVPMLPRVMPPQPRRRRGMGQTESLLSFLQDTMGDIQVGGNFPIQGPGNDMSQFTVAQVLTWSAGQYCSYHSGIEPACANIPALVAQVAGPYANLPAIPSSLAAYQPRTGPVTWVTAPATPINWQQYTPPAAASTTVPVAGIAVPASSATSSTSSSTPSGTSALGITIPSWFTDPAQSLIPNVPNWGLVAAGVVALFLFTGKR